MQSFITEFFENLKIDQPQNGYRFSIDPFLLCSEIPHLTNQTILDIGCGSGIIPLILKFKNSDIKIFGVEIQSELAELAEKNVRKNSMEQNISIMCKDIKDSTIRDFGEKIDIIVSNPPYKKEKSGRLNPDKQKAVARHEIKLNIQELLQCCKRLLSSNGRVYIIFPAERISDLLYNMNENRIKPETIRFVHTKKDNNAKLIIVSGIKTNIKGMFQKPVTAPPLNIYDSPEIPL